MKEGFLFTKNTKVLLFAIVIGILAVVLLHYSTQARVKQLVGDTVRVIAARKEIKEGNIIEASALTEIEIPKTIYSSEMYGPGEITQLVGAMVNTRIPSGTPIMSSWIGAANPERLAEVLDADARERTFTLSVDNEATIGGRLKRGDIVDILWTENQQTRVLFQAVDVIDVQGNLVTLKVTIHEAMVLSLVASGGGRLTFMLRNPKETILPEMEELKMSYSELTEAAKNLSNQRRDRLVRAKKL